MAAVGATEPLAAPITIFAPNNGAFEEISAVVDGLSAEEVLAVRPPIPRFDSVNFRMSSLYTGIALVRYMINNSNRSFLVAPEERFMFHPLQVIVL